MERLTSITDAGRAPFRPRSAGRSTSSSYYDGVDLSADDRGEDVCPREAMGAAGGVGVAWDVPDQPSYPRTADTGKPAVLLGVLPVHPFPDSAGDGRPYDPHSEPLNPGRLSRSAMVCPGPRGTLPGMSPSTRTRSARTGHGRLLRGKG
jgi:hypothetical protein